MHTSYYLRYLKRKQTVAPLPTTPENVTALPCEMWGYWVERLLRFSGVRLWAVITLQTQW